jgi:glycosyltransferase involved in cell wall biosynthesis
MKVCIVSLNIVPLFGGGQFGGAEVQANFVGRALAACGQHVSMVVSNLPQPDVIPFPAHNAFDSSQGVRGLRFFHPRWTGVMSALERANAEVYFQHCPGMVTGLTARYCRRAGKVFVYGAGSDADFSPHPVGVHGMRDKLLFGYGLNACDGFVVQNEVQRTAAQKRFDRPMRVIPTGIWPIEDAADSQGGAVVWIGGMWKIKRPGLFLELARRIPHRRFQLIGDGGDLEAETRAGAKRLHNVEMLGRLGREDVDRVLRRAALLVNTSSVEGFPNAFLEAWNHGLPVVTFRDIDGIIQGADVGAVCSSIEEMADTIQTMLDDVARLRGIRGRALALVRERYSPQVLGPQYVEFFEELRQSTYTSAMGAGVVTRSV